MSKKIIFDEETIRTVEKFEEDWSKIRSSDKLASSDAAIFIEYYFNMKSILEEVLNEKDEFEGLFHHWITTLDTGENFHQLEKYYSKNIKPRYDKK